MRRRFLRRRGRSAMTGSRIGRGDMTETAAFKADEVAWQPHPMAEGFEIKVLAHKPDTKVKVQLVRARKGAVLAEHTHDTEDIFYVLDGGATIWIEGKGDIPLSRGMVIRVPKDAVHKVYNISDQGYLVLDMFVP